eukprot:CAMPEP_0117028906 /NCGR_PEP_ID=MMETSP0472-20121206/20979_1 /TAXON_ID=693140 ORGANISM="Tiarina fusus, Strain LIS" /NCGR_SAMPLE_ID=MMETSP0472 /ASSEMBLY_ACC=CAM_ASM_000603 /LENGTH=236 /DNA_ID=CAMNT_0004736529 /DNA_START=167 /DNA_END=877 /DNA_ORIENTATION=-
MTPRTPAASATPRVSNPTPNSGAGIKKPYTGTGPLLISNKQENKELSFFNLLYTDMGFKNCQKFFQDESSATKGTFTENQFIHFMRELTDLGDYQIVEMFDIFDCDDTGIIGFKSFFLLFSLIAALETGNGKQFLYLHLDAMFELIARSSTATHVTWQEFIRFGYLMGINECDIYNYLSMFNINIFHKISREEFEMYYFVVVDTLDERKKNTKNEPTDGTANFCYDTEEDKRCSIM